MMAVVLSAAIVEAQDAEALQKWGREYERQIVPLLKSHCMDCHGGDDPSGEFDLSGLLDREAALSKLTVWDQVGARIRLNEMPPPGSRQFSDPEKGRIYAWLDSKPEEDHCRKLATDETQAWYKGYVMSRRLTKTEYLNAMRDLLGVAVDARFAIPSDGAGGVGFDTNGSTLFTSPIHIEQYLAAADDTVRRVLSDQAQRQQLIGTLDSQPDALSLATEILKTFGRRAWRRPVSDDELQRLLHLYAQASAAVVAVSSELDQPASSADEDQTGEASQGVMTAHLSGLHAAMTAVLVSPNFLFVVEAESDAGGVQRLTAYELAMRLSLFLWSSVPDDILLDAAAGGRLETDDDVRYQTRRMLADPRARALGENFGLQWLGLANFLEGQPDPELFPEYNRDLAADLREEVIRIVAGIFQENRSLLDLVVAPQVPVNGRLAQHYGIPLDSQAGWQMMDVGDLPRGGVITSGAVLVQTSYPRRTSPVLRGRWLLEEILGSRVPPPPPGVPALDESVGEQVVSLREKLELHRRNPECAACHDRMDPLGFGLENFDALGRWRETDHGQAIDSQGTLPSGQTFSGPQELKQVLLERSSEFQRHFVRKLLGFALGRELTKFDDCVVDDSLRALQENQMQAQSVIETIVTSYPFQHRYFKAAETK